MTAADAPGDPQGAAASPAREPRRPVDHGSRASEPPEGPPLGPDGFESRLPLEQGAQWILLVSVFVVLFTQLISDIGYAYLNPRIRVQ